MFLFEETTTPDFLVQLTKHAPHSVFVHGDELDRWPCDENIEKVNILYFSFSHIVHSSTIYLFDILYLFVFFFMSQRNETPPKKKVKKVKMSGGENLGRIHLHLIAHGTIRVGSQHGM